MRVGLYYGWELTGGANAADLYAALLEQVECADYLGFDSARIGENQGYYWRASACGRAF